MKVAILGTGAYGMAICSIARSNNLEIKMWTNSEEEKDMLLKMGKSNKVDYVIPKDIIITTDMKEAVVDSDIIMFVVPAEFTSSVAKELKKYYNNRQTVCIASKGIEQNTCLFLYDIVARKLETSNISVISGGTFASDIVKKEPCGLSLATRSKVAKERTIKALSNNYIKLRYTKDIIGTELCGAIKNVIAIASGMIDGMGYSRSTSAMFITESLNDIKNLIKTLGGNKKSILSFAGFGDLLLTSTSDNSRNYTLGKMIGEGKDRKEVANYIDNTTIEGLYTLKSIKKLLRNKKIKMPIIDLIY